MVQTVLFVCVLACPLPGGLAAHCQPQAKPSPGTGDRILFKVTDSENELPIPEAAVSLIYWQKKVTAEEKKEIEVKTDKNGVAEFPRVTAEKFAVSVIVKGYRPCWRWLRPDRSKEPIRIRLEKWVNTPK